MKKALRILPLCFIYLLLTSATAIEKTGNSLSGGENMTSPGFKNTRIKKAHKLNFFQRLVVKFYLKKQKLQDAARADKLASTSLWLGVAACGFLVLGLFIPYVILAAIPAGIAAMVTGGSAVRNGTTQIGKAKTGKGLGLGALIAFAVVLIAAIIIVASSTWLFL